MFNNNKAESISVGQSAPAFNLLDQSGISHSLESYKGKWLVMYFYPKDDTPGCTKEACAFRDEYQVISEANTQLIGISVDTKESHAKFADKFNLPFPLLVDPNGEVAKHYQSLTSLGPIKFAKRHSFIIDPQGRLQKIYRKVDPSKHSQEIINDLKSLQAQ